MKKRLLNIALVLFVITLGVVACSDAQDIEPIDFDSSIELEDRIKSDSDTGDIVG